MPGIFGCLAIDPEKRLDTTLLDRTFEKMSSCLKHLESYKIDRQIDPRGRWMLGRIGHQNLMGTDLKFVGRGRSTETRFYGVLTRSKKASEAAISSGGDPLIGISFESGYFSAFSIDDSNNRMAIIVDRRASEPVFYVESGGVLFFAPEVKALLHLGVSPGELDVEGLASFMGAGYLLPHQTLFSNVKKLKSRHALIVENSRCNEFEYWKYEPGSLASPGSRENHAEALAELVKNSILGDFGTPEKTMTFLSGGLDSRYILACIARSQPQTASSLHTVTWAERVETPHSDPVVAAEIAQKLGVRHQFIQRSIDEYESWFKETNYLLDGHSEVPAVHPHEFQIMKNLHKQGFNTVLRGDEAFGLRGMVYSADSALANIGIRPFPGIRMLSNVMEKKWYDLACTAGNESYKTLIADGAGMDPVDFKDVCYFSLRVPTYLSSASYYKQVLFDHRNPLLSNEILDYYREVPLSLRLNKKLFFQAFNFAHPDLAKIPYSSAPGTEDWGVLMVKDTPLRRMILKELADEDSGVWEIFDRQKTIDLFNEISISRGTTQIPTWKKPLRQVRTFATGLIPAQMDRVALKRAQAKLRVSHLFFRIMTFKNWHDTFVANRN